MADHEWELSKENVAPLRQGRDVQVLNKALKTPKAQLEAQRIIREAEVRDAVSGRGSLSDDPLQAWSAYIKWLVEHYPAGCDVLVRAIEEVCRTYAKSDRYRDDIRLLRLWVRYIDLREDKLDAFNYMNRRRIGGSWSLFYEAWAITLELARRYDDAQKVYRDGREKNAKPVERLALREEEFQNRMAARKRRDEKKRLDAERRGNKESLRGETRSEQAGGVRSRNSLANRILSTSEVGRSASNFNSVSTARPALGQITEVQAKTGLRPMALEHNFGSTAPRVTETREQGQTSQNQTFEVYSDPSNSSTSNAHGADHNPKSTDIDEQILPELAKRGDLRKENEGLLPAKWTGQVLPQENKLRSKLQKEASIPFEVFQDPVKISSPNDRIIAAAISEVRGSRAEEISGCEKIREGSNVCETTSGSAIPKSWLRCPEEGYVSPTINTKLAMKEVDDIFNSSQSQSLGKEYSPIPSEIIDAKYDNEKPFTDIASKNRKLDSKADVRNLDVSPSRFQNSLRATENRSTALLSKQAVEAQKVSATEERSGATKSENDSGMLKASGEYDMTEFLASWCNSDSHFQLLEDPDPDIVENDIFDLHCRQGLVSLHVENFRRGGCTGQSYVVLADDLNNRFGLMNMSEETDSDEEDFKVIAIKVSESSNAWEYYMYKTVHSRLATPSKSIAHAVAFCEGNPKSFLILDSHSRCSLSAAHAFYVDKRLPETLAMFFTVSILRVIEELHGIGVIHADLTLDNILFRYDLAADISNATYSANGQTEWKNWGILLVDFNRSVDSRHPEVSGMDVLTLGRHIRESGDSFLDSDYRIPNSDGWAYNADCNAISTCAAKMLGLSSSDIMGPLNGLQHAQTWQNFFSTMQELEASATARETRKAIATCFNEMGKILENDRLLSVSLMQLVNHVVDAENDEMTKGF